MSAEKHSVPWPSPRHAASIDRKVAQSLGQFKQTCSTLATTDTHGDNTIALITTL